MNQQILSQDEVDALLQGITGESQKLDHDEEPTGGTRDYDLASQERIVRGRMPTLEIINERFARNIRLGLFNFIRKSPEISIGSIKVQKYSAFLREIVVPTNFNIVSVRPLRGSGLIVCDPTLVFAVIDALFGGAGKYHTRIEGRDFSLTANTSVGSHTISPAPRSGRTLMMLKLVGTTISRRKALYFCTLMMPIEISELLRMKLNRPSRM